MLNRQGHASYYKVFHQIAGYCGQIVSIQDFL